MDYDYQVCEDSDSEGYDSSSSEDAFEAYVRQKYLSRPDDDEEDFEKEMEKELSATFKHFEQRQLFDAGSTDPAIGARPTRQQLAVERQGGHATEKPGQPESGLRDAKTVAHKTEDSKQRIAIDKKSPGGTRDQETEVHKADDSVEMTPADDRPSKPKGGSDKDAEKSGPSNDDLFYDPEMDDEDEKWVNEQRRSCIFPNESKQEKDGGKVKPLPLSDAVLNCPGCMTLLCLDCQRHEIYNTQYRAMFVKNCVVDRKETLRCLPSRSSARRRNLPEGVHDPRDLFNPVRCQVCRTEVAVYDSEEVYHFFNVIASFS
uniref:E2F associated phosphoprotein n=1 Tax=Rhipicephalus zambeziensis TaxID=60191 RepID=A0A224YDI9_9ACAR